MTQFKLTYFNGRGRGEIARVMFAAADVKYEDHRIEMADWPKIKPTTSHGYLPILTVDGKCLHQSGAIYRYLAAKFGFMGSNDWEAALINETAEIGDDLFRPMAESVFSSNEARKAELRKALPEVIIPKTIKLLEMRLKENGNNGFFVGDKLSLADVAIFVLLQPMMENPDLAAAFKDHCAITEHVKRIGAIPAIKKWVGIRPKTPI